MPLAAFHLLAPTRGARVHFLPPKPLMESLKNKRVIATLLTSGGDEVDVVDVAVTVDAGFSRRPSVAVVPSSSALARG